MPRSRDSTRRRRERLPDPPIPRTAPETFNLGSSGAHGQRFRVLRPHARGGLGAVFVALDRELNREVALKQILDRHADDPESRSRFLVEAEVTGGLEHPGIVPVYGLGSYDDGRPFYAMRFIRGDSLKDAIAGFHDDLALKSSPGRRSLELRKLLRRFLDVCNAVDYAHSRGVLHRDLKPGNVIVGRHGETLVVDWGLAKAVGHVEAEVQTEERPITPSSLGGTAQTEPGHALGTPAYMSPEQADGDRTRLGARSDVYSLGATLYSLLTGKAPFEGSDVAAVLRAVKEGPQTPPRQLDPAIDRALEAVCLKAMARNPEKRYASCRALADYDESCMADEPVTAYAEPASRRVGRWAEKPHRTLVTSSAVGLTLALVLLGASYRRETRLNASLAQANLEVNRRNADLLAANNATTKAEQLADSRLDRAMKAIEDYYRGVSAEAIRGGQIPPTLRDRLLEKPQAFYEDLARELIARPDPSVRELRLLAKGQHNLGFILSSVGRKEESLEQYEASAATSKTLVDRDPKNAAFQHSLAGTYSNLAITFRSAGKGDESIRTMRDSIRHSELAVSLDPNVALYQSGLARRFMNLAAVLVDMGQLDEERRN